MEKSYNIVFSQRQRFCFAKKFHKLICFSALFFSFLEYFVKESNSKNFLGRDIFKNVKINYYSIYFQDQKKKTLKTHACCILDAFVIHRNMKNSKNNAQFSPSYVPILVCYFSNIYNLLLYIHQMLSFFSFPSLIKAFLPDHNIIESKSTSKYI